MTYEELIKITNERNLKGEKVSFTEEEAKLYFGEELYSLIKKIYDLCKKSGYIIYEHATDVESAEDIIKRGFRVSIDQLDELPTDLQVEEPVDIEYDDENVKTLIFNGKKCKIRSNGIRDELSDTQHFSEISNCRLDFGSIINPNINRSGIGATCLFVVSKNVTGSREYMQYGITEPHFDEFDDKEIPETYFERRVIPRQYCMGYLDVKNKKFIFNKKFQPSYGVTDEFELTISNHSEDDLRTIIHNGSRRK
jgi:hypothetical protein